MISLQETFDTIVKHLRKQDKKAIDGICCVSRNPNCRYRTKDGLKCAAGCLIPDELYDPKFEGQSAEAFTNVGKCLLELGHRTDLVLALQNVHDLCDIKRWEDEFVSVAGEYKLTVPKKKSFERVYYD